MHLLIVAKQCTEELVVSIYPPTLSLYCAGLIAQNVKDVLTGLDDGLYTLLLVGVRSKLACPILNASLKRKGKEKRGNRISRRV